MAAHKPRILVVEDEAFFAPLVEPFLVEMGCECVGSLVDLQAALQSAYYASFDAAILDLVNDGKHADSIANALAGRGIPFGLASGAHRRILDGEWKDRPHLRKPYTLAGVRQFLADLLASTTVSSWSQVSTRDDIRSWDVEMISESVLPAAENPLHASLKGHELVYAGRLEILDVGIGAISFTFDGEVVR